MTCSSHADAIGLIRLVMTIASAAQAEGWEVNLAAESGGGTERVTFSAQRCRKDNGTEQVTESA
jgi:hypothetical protein